MDRKEGSPPQLNEAHSQTRELDTQTRELDATATDQPQKDGDHRDNQEKVNQSPQGERSDQTQQP